MRSKRPRTDSTTGLAGVPETPVPAPDAVARREIMDEERRRIARELRDTTAENLASAIARLERIAKVQRDNQGKVSDDMDEAIALCLRSLGEVRCLAYELAPPGLQAGRLVDSLKRLATTFARRTGFAVMLLAAPFTIDDDLTRESSEALYRAAEESLYGARRHPGATSVSLHVHRTEGELRLEVRDDGRWVATDAPQGQELSEVRERLEACGGWMRMTASPGGTVLAATVPAGREEHPLHRTRR